MVEALASYLGTRFLICRIHVGQSKQYTCKLVGSLLALKYWRIGIVSAAKLICNVFADVYTCWYMQLLQYYMVSQYM